MEDPCEKETGSSHGLEIRSVHADIGQNLRGAELDRHAEFSR